MGTPVMAENSTQTVNQKEEAAAANE